MDDLNEENIAMMKKKKTVKTLSINFFPSSGPSLIFSIKKGMRTDIETIDATETKIKF